MGVPIPVAAIIGSAVSTVVNGGTFASFAIGVGIGIAAGYIASPFGDSIKGFAQGFGGLKDVIGYALQGALQGSIAGAISSAVYGQNILRGMGEGAIAGGAAGCVSLTVEFLFNMALASLVNGFARGEKILLTYKTTGSSEAQYAKITSAADLVRLLAKIQKSGEKITFFEMVGHGFGGTFSGKDQRGAGYSLKGGGIVAHNYPPNVVAHGGAQLQMFRELLQSTFAPGAVIELESCYSAFGSKSIAHEFKGYLPNARVYGYTGKVWQSPIPGQWESWEGWMYCWTTKWIEVTEGPK